MPKLLTLLVSSLLFVSCTDKGEDSAEPPPDGAALYSSKCAACHGEDGTGNTVNLPEIVPERTDEELANVINDGTGSMPGGLLSSAEEVDAVIDHLRVTWGE